MIKEIINSIHSISRKSIVELENITEYTTLEKGQTFIHLGERNNHEYFLLDGICRSYLLNPEGSEITLSFFTSNTILSPHTTRAVNGLSILNFETLTNSKFGIIDASKFEGLMVNNLEIRDFGNTVLRNELSKKINKEIGMAAYSAKERLKVFREEYHSLENYVRHTDIATYLGITNISLSRLRKELMKKS